MINRKYVTSQNKKMSLQTNYSNFLKAVLETKQPNNISSLLSCLQQEGYELVAYLLKIYLDRGQTDLILQWKDKFLNGRKVWLGCGLPVGAEAGDLWFDPLELSVMTLLPREPFGEDVDPRILARLTPFVSWMSLCPVAIWQFNAFLELAEIQIIESHGEWDNELFKRDRPASKNETTILSGFSSVEAKTYANWFGKGVADQEDWQAIHQHFPNDIFRLLWGEEDHIELGGFFEEDYVILLREDTIFQDLDDEWDNEPELGEKSMFIGKSQPLNAVFFRTHVSTQIGLIEGVMPFQLSSDSVILKRILPRHEFITRTV
jgi:hypothetical protein